MTIQNVSKAVSRTILVVEDERPLLEVIRLKLENSGFDIITARSAEQAIDFLKHVGSVDLVWLDHYLLGKNNGVSFVEFLKKHKEWQQIPILVVSNSSSDETRQQYLKIGVNRFYVKAETPLEVILKDVKSLL